MENLENLECTFVATYNEGKNATEYVSAIPEGYMAVVEKDRIVLKKMFEVGDWCVDCQGFIKQITDVKDGLIFYRKYEKSTTELFCATFGYAAANWRRWNVNDAKNGDIVMIDKRIIAIFKEKREDTFCVHCSHTGVHWLFENGFKNTTDIRPATIDEKAFFYKELHIIGKVWNADIKAVVSKKVYIIVSNIDTMEYNVSCYELYEDISQEDFVECWKRGVVFNVQESAQAFADKLNAAIRPIVEKRKNQLETIK